MADQTRLFIHPVHGSSFPSSLTRLRFTVTVRHHDYDPEDLSDRGGDDQPPMTIDRGGGNSSDRSKRSWWSGCQGQRGGRMGGVRINREWCRSRQWSASLGVGGRSQGTVASRGQPYLNHSRWYTTRSRGSSWIDTSGETGRQCDLNFRFASGPRPLESKS